MTDPPRPINGAPVDWELPATPTEPAHSCPNCGEQTMIEVAGREGYCNVCGKAFRLPKET